jgi:hypothetical protein
MAGQIWLAEDDNKSPCAWRLDDYGQHSGASARNKTDHEAWATAGA